MTRWGAKGGSWREIVVRKIRTSFFIMHSGSPGARSALNACEEFAATITFRELLQRLLGSILAIFAYDEEIILKC
jgi:hypothetical protein